MKFFTAMTLAGALLSITAPGRANPEALEAARESGAARSKYLKPKSRPEKNIAAPTADLEGFKKEIEPLLRESCVQCHGEEKQKGKFRIDTLNPDLVKGEDASWWLEVFDVLSNGEMPPPDDDVELSDEGRSRMVDWLSDELQVASQVRRSEEGHSSFRRMTRYELNYALQDLLGLPYDFAGDLPPETASEDGFKNSSEMLQMSASQFAQYRDLSRKALQKAAVRGEQPVPVHYQITMSEVADRIRAQADKETEKVTGKYKDDPEKLAKELEKQKERFSYTGGGIRHVDRNSGESLKTSGFSYRGSIWRYEPINERPEFPAVSTQVCIIPAKNKLKLDLGDHLPDSGNMRVRVRAARASAGSAEIPDLRLLFGFQASNNSNTSFRVGDGDLAVTSEPGEPAIYEWIVPLGEISRNPYRHAHKLGSVPNPAEYLVLQNIHHNPGVKSLADIQIDCVEITAPYFKQWPPESHTRIFADRSESADEEVYLREVLKNFMKRAWRRPVTEAEIDQKVALHSKLRPHSEDFQEAVIKVLATVCSSSKFLYLAQNRESLTDYELATRLSMFLWCSVPDEELISQATQGKLNDPAVLKAQTERLLADPRADRFARHFVRQWLGMELLDYLKVEKKAYPRFDEDLKASMQKEPVALFKHLLEGNRSVMDFIHADYGVINERLASHYRLPRRVYGNHFQEVPLRPEDRRGGLMTQAGLLAMNSDGKDSHPLKRGIWLLENILHDPPPPPPPAVPEIDLADPEILKMTLKERMEDHRNDPACMSCHAKIDPWGIAFENFDAVGSWRETVSGKPVDAKSVLFNQQELDGMEGLKRYLLEHRQDQFARALTHKLSSYALGRPLTFADRSDVEQITADLRREGDGLSSLITLIVSSELFRSK